MFVWGSTIHGELGLGGIEEEQILTPRKLEWFGAETVTEVACGENHTLLLTKDGKVYSCGNNDYGQLGHDQPRKRPQPVTGLDAYNVTHVACGSAHSVALNQWGQVFSWGSDTYGQLGHQLGQSIQPVPKIVRALAVHHVVQIACGQRHTVVLANNGDIYAFGGNSHGQLGIGSTTPCETTPTVVASLKGIPLAFIACGANHTFALSRSGAVFGWGKNTHGQLGLSHMDSKTYPTQLRSLRNRRVRYISCGEEFSTFLTMDGGVFTCGAGMYGQLGHGSNSNEILPRQVIELMGSTVTQLACGRQHCLALVPSRGRVYSFGLGFAGQLGLRKATNASTPQAVLGPWVSPGGKSLINNDETAKNYVVHRIFAGGSHCFVTVTKREEMIEPHDCRVYNPTTQILVLNYDYLSNNLRLAGRGRVDQEFLSYLEVVFRSVSCLSGSFLLANEQHYCCTSKHHGMDLELAEKTFTAIARSENGTVKELIWNCITQEILPKLAPSPPDVEVLRVYLILPLYHEFNNARQHKELHKPFVNAVLKLQPQGNRVLSSWWAMASKDYFEKLVIVFKGVVGFIIRGQRIPETKTIFYDPSLLAMLDMMAFLNKLNHNADGLKVSYDIFHLNDLSEMLDIRYDYVLWLQDQNTNKLFLCNYPFLFDAHAKVELLQTDQSLQMQSAMNEALQRAFLTAMLAPSQQGVVQQFLVLNVTRENIVADTLRELSTVNTNDLKKPLKVKFHGEEAEDAGGVTKEFFLLLLREILDPKYGMFKEYEETRAIWFSEDSFEDEEGYLLIGMICGLAIYNFTIINIPFPLALYKKLLREPVILSDLKGLSPNMANSLQSLLDYDGEDMEEVFGLTFEVTREVFGEVRLIPLKANGAQIAVTQENKHEYVDLYVDFIFNKSVEKHYSAFSAGFMKVCGGRVLRLFHSHELMAVVVGNENYDWHALEESTEYKNGYKSSDQTIRWFWEVLHELSEADKKKFLLFLTGSDRIPIQGMKAIKIVIQPTNDDKFLPVAHTCFNLLDLPKYQTKEKLKYKLLQAIQQTEGFSLV